MKLKDLKPSGAAQVVWGILVIAAIVVTFAPRNGGGIVPAAQRKAMPELNMPDLSGKAWRLSEQKGKVVLVNFWASWCPPCRAETPGLVKLANEYRNRGFAIAGVSMDDSDVPARKFAASARIPYPVLLPPADSPYAAAIQSLPTTFLIDKSGRVAAVFQQAMQESHLREDVDRLLKERD